MGAVSAQVGHWPQPPSSSVTPSLREQTGASPEQLASCLTLTRNGLLADSGHEVLIEPTRDRVQPGPRVARRLHARNVLAWPIRACLVSTWRP